MSFSPLHQTVMNPAFRLTPAYSPFVKNGTLRSPYRASRSDLMLSLRQVIGTTASSANAFDSLPSERIFAFTAGAAAVVVSVDDDLNYKQRFFRARPSATAGTQTPSVYGTSTPSHNSSRTAASLRDAGVGVSHYGSPGSDWADSPGGKSLTAKDRIKAATCVSFSSDGKFLAVGETGYKPRVLVFSTSPDASPDAPVTSMVEHAFGVRAVAFSPDSRYLASLGSANDGFLYIWSINPRTGAAILHSSNKCTNHINRIAWLGNSLVIVGTRVARVWRIDESEHPQHAKPRQGDVNVFSNAFHKTLQGRNCVLGSLVEANFTSVTPVSSSMAVVSTDRGDICLLDDSEKSQRLYRVATVPFGVSALATDNGSLHVGGFNGELKTFEIKQLTDVSTPPPSPVPRSDSPTSPSLKSGDIPYIIAIAPIAIRPDQAAGLLITVDSRRAIRFVEVNRDEENSYSTTSPTGLPAQGEGVLGVHSLSSPNRFEASFVTWSADGVVKFWDSDGHFRGDILTPLEQIEGCEEPNELKKVRSTPSASFIAAGDKYGVLSVTEGETKKVVSSLKAHSAEITDIAVFDGEVPLIATAARDRTAQVFQKKGAKWELTQTLDEHVGAVTGLLFSRDGQRLLSHSTDRTVVVRDYLAREEGGATMAAFLIARTITLKSTPVSMVFDGENEHVLVVSTIDRQVHKYDVRSGQPIGCFKASDSDGGESVVFSDLVHFTTAKGQNVIAGVSSTDKSIRLYDESGTLLGRDWGHTEGVTDIALVTGKGSQGDDAAEQSQCLVTVAVDGTIFVWNLDFKSPGHALNRSNSDLTKHLDLAGVSTPDKGNSLLSNQAPLRRVLSQSELAKYQRPSSSHGSEDGTPDSTPVAVSVTTPTGSSKRSPPTLRKRPSRINDSTPKLEPSPLASGSGSGSGSAKSHALRVHTSRRNHARDSRSPSPPSPSRAGLPSPRLPQSPRNGGGSPKQQHSPKHHANRSPKGSLAHHAAHRRPSFGGPTAARMHKSRSHASLREQSAAVPSSSSHHATASSTSSNISTHGGLAQSTESLCKSLRAWRKKVSSSPLSSADASVSADLTRELERELALTVRVVEGRGFGGSGSGARDRGEREGSEGLEREKGRDREKEKERERHKDGIDEAAMVRLLDAYSERLVRVLEQRIESRVDEVVGRKGIAGHHAAAEKETEASDVDDDVVDAEAEADIAVEDDGDNVDTRAQQQPQ
ncbi:WD40-repeat-containing domain protein [Phyllosticta capitalensis]